MPRLREYPAYARTIAAHIVRGQKPVCVGVLLSSRWRYFDHVAKVCIKPDEWGRGRYEFGYLRGIHAVAAPGDDCAPAQLGELLLDLMAAGPRYLWVFDPDGKKVYDGDFASDLSDWVFDLVGGKSKMRYAAVRAVVGQMTAAQARAAQAELRELEALTRRGGPEAAVAHYQREEALKQRVRELFASPFQDIGEPAAA
jgi:hypothetical protein